MKLFNVIIFDNKTKNLGCYSLENLKSCSIHHLLKKSTYIYLHIFLTFQLFLVIFLRKSNVLIYSFLNLLILFLILENRRFYFTGTIRNWKHICFLKSDTILNFKITWFWEKVGCTNLEILLGYFIRLKIICKAHWSQKLTFCSLSFSDILYIMNYPMFYTNTNTTKLLGLQNKQTKKG